MGEHAPGVGPASDDYRGTCDYTGLHPGTVTCGQPAAIHVLTDSPGYGLVALASCAEHASVARAAGPAIDEHVHHGVCGIPGVLWFHDGCRIDDSGVEPELVGVGAKEAPDGGE